MVDLSAWDFAEDFSGEEVAALILGLEPPAPGEASVQLGPVVEKLARHYEDAKSWHRDNITDTPLALRAVADASMLLVSCQMCRQLERCKRGRINEHELFDWLSKEGESDFLIQRFDRAELIRWLQTVGLPSRYGFAGRQGVSEQSASPAWPSRKHRTKMLDHLDAAIERFWVRYDPTDITTAPTNEVVSTWLQERGVSKKMADCLASAIRADDVPAGPRPKY